MRLFRTSRTRRTVQTANHYFVLGGEQARRLGHVYVGSEHILLGLAGRTDSLTTAALARLGVTAPLIEDELRRRPQPLPPTAIDPQALATLGIDLHAVREHIDGRFGEGALESTRRGCWPVEPSLKRALAHAIDAAGGQTPTEKQVLAGLLAVEDSGAARLLHRLGITEHELENTLRDL